MCESVRISSSQLSSKVLAEHTDLYAVCSVCIIVYILINQLFVEEYTDNISIRKPCGFIQTSKKNNDQEPNFKINIISWTLPLSTTHLPEI